jgi:hypothetical protein
MSLHSSTNVYFPDNKRPKQGSTILNLRSLGKTSGDTKNGGYHLNSAKSTSSQSTVTPSKPRFTSVKVVQVSLGNIQTRIKNINKSCL